MYLLLTDETNTKPSGDTLFFIYGGLFFPIERLLDLDREIEEIRRIAGYQPGDFLKFDTRVRPAHISIEKATEAKRKVVDLCLKLGCKFIAYIILHDIAINQDQDTLILQAADHVIGKYNYYLSIVGDYGICAVDNLPVNAEYQYLSQKFCTGLNIQGGQQVKLDRIKLFASTCINASHAASAIDIVLGSFRYCVNYHKNTHAAKEMITQVVQLMWHVREGDTYFLGERGLIMRPILQKIRKPEYRAEYEQLMTRLNELLKDTEPPELAA